MVVFLTQFTPAAIADPYGIKPNHEFGRTIASLLKEDQQNQAAYLIRNAGYAEARAIEQLWIDLSNENAADNEASGRLLLRHRLLRLYLQHGYCCNPQPIGPMVSDYLTLKERLKPANYSPIFRAETAKLLVEALHRWEPLSDEAAEVFFNRALDVLQKHPEDAAPFYLFEWLCNRSKGGVINVRRLTDACTTPENKVKLAHFLKESISYELSHEIALDALRHLANDEEAAALIFSAFRFGSPDSRSPEIVVQQLPIFIIRYADTQSVDIAFSTLLQLVFELQGVDAARLMIEEYASILNFNQAEIASHQSSVMTMALQQIDSDRRKPEDDEIVKHLEPLLAPLIDKQMDLPTRLGILTNAFRIYERLGKSEQMAIAAKTFVDLGNEGEHTSSDRYIVTEIAHFFMAARRFDDAINAWKMWRPPFMSCGAYGVDPTENQRMQLTACYLGNENYDAAFREISESLFAEKYCNGYHEITPLLLFYIYDRAGQLEDLKNIASEIEAVGIRHTDSRQHLFEDPKHPTWLPEHQNWGVRQLFKVRELAAKRDHAALRIFFKHTDGAFKDRSKFYDNDPLDNVFQWEAIKGLAMEPAAAIEIADQVLKVDSELTPDWFFLALLLSDDARAKDWLVKHCRIAMLSQSNPFRNSHYLLQCLPHLGPDGKAIMAELERRAANGDWNAVELLEEHQWYSQASKPLAPYKHSFPWPAPKNGSLPKSLMPYIDAVMEKESLAN